MRLGWNNTTNGNKKNPRKYVRHNFNCGRYNRNGKIACKSHYIKMKDRDAIVLADIRSMAALVVEDENAAYQQFLAHKAKLNAHQTEVEKKRLRDGKYHLNELQKLIPSIYEDKVRRTLTTESACVFMPFNSKELSQEGGVYYGLNQTTNNLIIFNRASLINTNGFILGCPGSGKSFSAVSCCISPRAVIRTLIR